MAYITEFQVTGRLDFPVDMLRYDSCYPTRTEDALAIVRCRRCDRPEKGSPLPVITLSTWHLTKNVTGLESARWSSFGWHIVEHSIHTRKV